MSIALISPCNEIYSLSSLANLTGSPNVLCADPAWELIRQVKVEGVKGNLGQGQGELKAFTLLLS